MIRCMKELIVAKSAGFCFGVRRSVNMAEELLKKNHSCKCLGMLIHNEDEVKRLTGLGLKTIASVDEAEKGENVLIRAHGASPDVINSLTEKGACIHDATCPKVKLIHKIVEKDSEDGWFILIIGMHDHPEVEAIRMRCRRYAVIENEDECKAFFDRSGFYGEERISVVAQTTQTRDNYEKCCAVIKKRCTNLKISDTICFATSTRQEEAADLSNRCDAMVVIGGRRSANSLHLAEICRESCEHVQFIERTDELDVSGFKQFQRVGLTAGASTPAWIIKEVSNKMSDELKKEETLTEKEPSFDELLEETLKTIYNGDKVNGTVVAITGTEISVDLGAKYSGFIPTTEFTDDAVKVEDAVKIGDTIEAIVVRVNDIEGTAMLSKKRLDASKSWLAVEEAVESNAVLEGVVTEENKGGIVVNVNGVRVFVPASQTDLPRDAELAQLLKQKVRLRITEVNKARKRVVGSIRKVAQAERRERIEKIWDEIEVGKKYQGVVKSLTSYGAFVDIGGIDGMVHVSELSWGRIRQPAEVVSVGDPVEVYVISFDKEKRKISLGYKDPNANPWTLFTNRYQVGDVAQVTIVKLMSFGAFAEILPGVDGLIHISQIANRRIEKPDDVLKVGDVVDAKITAIDEEKHKVSLSIRALLAPAAPVEEIASSEEVPAEVEPVEEALVYEVSAEGEASGNIPEETTEE